MFEIFISLGAYNALELGVVWGKLWNHSQILHI